MVEIKAFFSNHHDRESEVNTSECYDEYEEKHQQTSQRPSGYSFQYNYQRLVKCCKDSFAAC